MVNQAIVQEWYQQLKGLSSSNLYVTFYRDTFEFALFHDKRVFQFLRWYKDDVKFSDVKQWYEGVIERTDASN